MNSPLLPLTFPRSPPYRLLFVCLGNICRSPLAKAIFEHHAQQRSVAEHFQLDSCGTGGWHEGADADPRSKAVAGLHGVAMTHAARQVRPASDFTRCDLLLAMDHANQRDLIALGAPAPRVALIRAFDPTLHDVRGHELDVPDPYYGGDDGFERVFQMLDAACVGLLDACEQPHTSRGISGV